MAKKSARLDYIRRHKLEEDMNSPEADPESLNLPSLAQYGASDAEGSYPISFGRSLTGHLMVSLNGLQWNRADDPVEYALRGQLDVLTAMDDFLASEVPLAADQPVGREPEVLPRRGSERSPTRFGTLFGLGLYADEDDE